MNQSALSKLWGLLTRPQRKSAIMLLGLMIIGMVLETLGVGLIIPVIALITDENLGKNFPRLQSALDFLGNPNQKTLIVGAMLSLVGIYIVKAVFLGFLAWNQFSFAFGTQAELSQRLFKTFLSQPYTFHLQRNSSELIHIATAETQLLTFNTMLPLITTLGECFVFLGLAALLIAVEPFGAILIGLTLTIAAFVFYRITRARLTKWGEERKFHEQLRLQHLQQGLGGAKEVKLLGCEVEFIRQYSVHGNKSAKILQNQLTLQQFPRLWLELLAIIALSGLVILMIIQDRPLASIGPTLGLFAIAAFRLMPAVNRLLGAMQSLRFGIITINTIHNELHPERTAFVTVSKNTADNKPLGNIEICNLTFFYPQAHSPALTNISLTIRRGETIGIIGPSGSGKSTLVDVILGLLTPTSGKIIVGTSDIQSNLRGWQNQIGYVPQMIYLTDDSLRRNVALGKSDEEINDAAVICALKAAQLEEFVGTLPAGIETVVGERGIRLSGGQRQRIGIARALYHDPSVLVLDEATSALDTATEQGVMESITALHGTKTILIVAHRLSTVKHCDRVYRLEAGIQRITQVENNSATNLRQAENLNS